VLVYGWPQAYAAVTFAVRKVNDSNGNIRHSCEYYRQSRRAILSLSIHWPRLRTISLPTSELFVITNDHIMRICLLYELVNVCSAGSHI